MLEVEPKAVAQLAELKPGAELPEISEVEARLERIRRERERLGAVNLRAEEELREVETQHQTLTTERDTARNETKQSNENVSRLEKLCDLKGIDHERDVNDPFRGRVFVGSSDHGLYALRAGSHPAQVLRDHWTRRNP